MSARNASTPSAVGRHGAAVLAARQARALDGVGLWRAREELFPNLRFAPRVRDEVEALLRGEATFAAVVDRLAGIDRAVGAWRARSDGHPIYPFQVTPESASRKPKVMFEDGTGRTRCFGDHARFTPGAGRIHFILETEPHRHALIGYVGPKVL